MRCFLPFAVCLGAELVVSAASGIAQQPTTAQTVVNGSNTSSSANLSPAPAPMAVNISGTVTDEDGDLLPGAAVVVQGAQSAERHSVVADDNGAFVVPNLTQGMPYQVTISAKGFSNWSTTTPLLSPGEFYFVTGIKLRLVAAATSVTVTASTTEIATE